jgi:hypothetical protein
VPDGFQNIALLRLPALQEFAAHRGVEKQVLHGHLGAGGAAATWESLEVPALGHHPETAFGPRRPGQNFQTAHLGDAGQGLSPKTQGGDAQQIFFPADFAGGVAQERQGGLFRGHAPAVVHHPEEAPPPFLDLHGDVPGPGVQGVFHQLLYHRPRPGDHFPRGDERRGLGLQDLNAPHLFPLPSGPPWFMIPPKEGCDPVLLAVPAGHLMAFF